MAQKYDNLYKVSMKLWKQESGQTNWLTTHRWADNEGHAVSWSFYGWVKAPNALYPFHTIAVDDKGNKLVKVELVKSKGGDQK